MPAELALIRMLGNSKSSCYSQCYGRSAEKGHSLKTQWSGHCVFLTPLQEELHIFQSWPSMMLSSALLSPSRAPCEGPPASPRGAAPSLSHTGQDPTDRAVLAGKGQDLQCSPSRKSSTVSNTDTWNSPSTSFYFSKTLSQLNKSNSQSSLRRTNLRWQQRPRMLLNHQKQTIMTANFYL